MAAATVPHLPLLRAGRPYRSLQTAVLRDIRTGEPVAEVSQATAGMISRDQLQAAENRRALERFTVAELVEISRRAAKIFAEETLPLGEGHVQSPDDYVRQLAATTGMPEALGRSNAAKIVHHLEDLEEVLGGLTRGLDLTTLDRGWAEQGGRTVSYLRLSDALGAVLPNNSPGVHTLWLPAVALKTPLVLKPGSTEPWTPWRVAQAFLAAGCPPQAFSLYPADHAAGSTVLQRCARSMVFGDKTTVERWAGNPAIEVHGPGWSKVLLGPDQAPRYAEHLDLLASSVASNGGRSCINASGVWTCSHGREMAQALAERLAQLEPRPLDDPQAQLAAFADPEIARRLSALLDSQLEEAGAEDLSAAVRGPERVAEVGGCTFLKPTVVWCEREDHTLIGAEYGFPFVTVVEVGADELFDRLGPTLVGSVVSDDPDFRRRAVTAGAIDRLNLGAIPTQQLAWDQPHEGSLFDHLFRQRSFQAASA